MSAAGRGPRLGGPDDYYATPAWAVHRLLEAWCPPPSGLWVEPGAGDGAIIRACQALAFPPRWCAIECRATAETALRAAVGPTGIVEIGDFLVEHRTVQPSVTAVVGNPPFKDAEAFIRQARRCYPGADVAFLLRLPYLSSEDRLALWRDCGTPDVLVLPNRPSFTPDGRTDATDYCWMVWHPIARQLGYVRVLDATPVRIRKPGGKKS